MARRFVVLALLLPSLALAQTREESVKKALEAYVAANRVVGATVVVMKTDGTSYSASAGFQDRENKVPASERTLYRLGSISKPVTTVAALKLVEEGKLSLFSKINGSVPEWTNPAPITLRHLLTHTSGVRHYIPTKPDIYYERFPVSQSINVFKEDPLLFQPGEKVSYSTHAFSLVARMVETSSTNTFAEYIKTNVAVPSAAPTLSLEDRTIPSPDRSKLYDVRALGVPILQTKEEDISWKSGGGGMEASAPDLARFGMAAMTGKLLSPHLTDFMFQRQIVNGVTTNRGLGWAFGPHGQPEHGGAQQGCRCLMVLDREFGTVYVVMTNTGGNHPIPQLMMNVMAAWGERTIPPIWTESFDADHLDVQAPILAPPAPPIALRPAIPFTK